MRDRDGEDDVRRYEEEMHETEFGEANRQRRARFGRLLLGFLLFLAAVCVLAVVAALR
jgi:hypothetical protein